MGNVDIKAFGFLGPKGGPRQKFRKFFSAPKVFLRYFGQFSAILGKFWYYGHCVFETTGGTKAKISKIFFGAKCV
jgi:hypothetical protein